MPMVPSATTADMASTSQRTNEARNRARASSIFRARNAFKAALSDHFASLEPTKKIRREIKNATTFGANWTTKSGIPDVRPSTLAASSGWI